MWTAENRTRYNRDHLRACLHGLRVLKGGSSDGAGLRHCKEREWR